MPETWTIRRVLAWTAKDFAAKGVDNPRLDGEILVAHALGLERVGLYLDLDRPLVPDELVRVRSLVQRRREREPVAYIVGQREFYGRSFEVTRDVLVPRPDTETLVERALLRLPVDGEARIVDLCTGSGIVAVTLAAERSALRVEATELSPEAARVARRNAERHGVSDRVQVHVGDLCAPLGEEARFELIVANPPYVSEAELAELEPEVSRWEPRLALAGGPGGLTVVGRIAEEAPRRLVHGGHLLLEVGMGQAGDVMQRLAASGLEAVTAYRDLAGIERVIEGRRPGPPGGS